MYGVGMYCCCCRLPCVWVVAGRAMFGRNQSGKSGCYSLGWAGLGCYSLGWAGLGWAGLVVDRVDTQWWCRPSLCRGGGAFTWPVVGVGAMSPPHRRGYVTGMQISTHIYILHIHSPHSVYIYSIYTYLLSVCTVVSSVRPCYQYCH